MVEEKKISLMEYHQDNEFAWLCTCNIVMCMCEENVDVFKATYAAARLMKLLFDIDVTTYPQFIKIKKLDEDSKPTSKMNINDDLIDLLKKVKKPKVILFGENISHAINIIKSLFKKKGNDNEKI